MFFIFNLILFIYFHILQYGEYENKLNKWSIIGVPLEYHLDHYKTFPLVLPYGLKCIMARLP